MAIAHYRSGPFITTTDSGKNDGGTLVLTGATANIRQELYGILIRALGTITVTDIFVTLADGSTQLARFGYTGGLPNGGVFMFDSPICGNVNDNITIAANLTGATASSVCITALYKLAPK